MSGPFNAVPMTFASVWMYSRYKTSTVLRFCVTLILVGTAFRAVSGLSDSFWFVAGGKFLCSCANPFFVNVHVLIANKWFSDKERALATALMIVGSPIGVGCSYILTGYWFFEVTEDTPPEDFLALFKTLMYTQFGLAVVTWIIFNILIRENPEIPPSAVSEVKYEPLSCVQTIKALRDNCNFFALCIAYALPTGSFLAVGALMSNIFVPFGWEPSKIAFVCVGLLVSGVIGAVAFGAFLDKTRLYKASMIINLLAITISTGGLLVLLTWFLGVNWANWLQIILLLVGATLATGFYPLCISYGGELTFPLQPSFVNGMFTLSEGAGAILFSMIGALIVKEHEGDEDLDPDELIQAQRFRAKFVLGLLTITATISLIFGIFIKEDLKRLAYSKHPVTDATADEDGKQDKQDAIDKKTSP